MTFCTLDQGKKYRFCSQEIQEFVLLEIHINHVAIFTQKVKIHPLHLHYQNLQFKNLF